MIKIGFGAFLLVSDTFYIAYKDFKVYKKNSFTVFNPLVHFDAMHETPLPWFCLYLKEKHFFSFLEINLGIKNCGWTVACIQLLSTALYSYKNIDCTVWLNTFLFYFCSISQPVQNFQMFLMLIYLKRTGEQSSRKAIWYILTVKQGIHQIRYQHLYAQVRDG